ncbi:hypothetical protein B0A52_08658 [Exophiala mesophila]|uniref:Uncharacterized protein n=1 Tax=Exophiala mesophila TaxID=212818 RepID=A0A438MYZ3_EXOME|nr:hypothetical protein B0A52_08658 [Exophiala mesophila]
MASTPPAQFLSTPATPPSPLHGARYDLSSVPTLRRSTRTATLNSSAAQRKTPDPPQHSQGSRALLRTPKPGKQTKVTAVLPDPSLHSPAATPKHRTSRRVQVFSPPSPESQYRPPPRQKHPNTSHLQSLTSASTIISNGMLPTPVKTPRKKTVSNTAETARMLFQDSMDPVDLTPPQPTPRRPRRNKRHNGFTLESFSAQTDTSDGQVQIYTDSRDRVPEVDRSASNPFIETRSSRKTSSQTVPGTVKRRKINGDSRVDAQVQQALDKDEGMVYTFRGRKIYRPFNDETDESEIIAAEDYASAEDVNDADRKPMRTLTRKSIKPTRLFETEVQKRARDLEREEEADTDIEDSSNWHNSKIIVQNEDPHSEAKLDPPTSDESGEDHRTRRSHRSKKGSPFDTWPRVRGSSAKGKKRGALEMDDELMGSAGLGRSNTIHA